MRVNIIAIRLLSFFIIYSIVSSRCVAQEFQLGTVKNNADISVSQYFTADVTNIYHIDIKFLFSNDEERKHIKSLVGEARSVCLAKHQCGTEIIFNVQIYNDSGMIVFSGDIISLGYYYYSSTEFSRNILKIKLDKGQYLVKIASISKLDSLVDIKATLDISTDPRQIIRYR